MDVKLSIEGRHLPSATSLAPTFAILYKQRAIVYTPRDIPKPKATTTTLLYIYIAILFHFLFLKQIIWRHLLNID